MGFYANVLFPKFYDRIVQGSGLEAGRERVVPQATGDVLEIGIGTGLNLPYFSDAVTSLHGIDPNPGMLRQLEARLTDTPFPITPVQAGAERLPFPDDHFDTVLTTHTLCSIPDVAASLAEMRRVLRPSGRLLFIEHGESPDAGVARWQRRLNRVQRIFAVGCRLDLRVADALRDAGFTLDELTTAYAEELPRTHGYLYEGVGRKT